MNNLLVRVIEENSVINLNNIKETLTLLNEYTGGIELECSRSTYLCVVGIGGSLYMYRVGSGGELIYEYIPAKFLGYLITTNEDVPRDYIQIKLR